MVNPEAQTLNRRDFLKGMIALGAAQALSHFVPPDAAQAETPLPPLDKITQTAESIKQALEGQEIEPQYRWDEVSVSAEANQFGDGWDKETAEKIKTAAEEVIGIFGQAYPDEKMFFDQVAVRPSTPQVINYIREKFPEHSEENDHSKTPFVIYPGTFKEGEGLLPGIYWLGDFEGKSEDEDERNKALLAHELFHYVYHLGEEAHNLERFSTFGASWIVQKYLAKEPLPGPEESPLKEIEAHAREAAKNPCICYIVQSGDNLWNLAEKHGVSLGEILRMNRGKFVNPDRIFPGDQIVIPAPGMETNQFCGCIWPLETP